MKGNRKNRKQELARENINRFFELMKDKSLSEYHRTYARWVRRLATGFNIRLSRAEKLRFCKKCFAMWPDNCKIRLNSATGCKEFVCSCGHIKRIRYK